MIAPYMPLFVADYLADTAHLSAAEHGAYLMLLMNYWQRQKPLPADDKKLARIARMTDVEWSDARDTLAEMFQEADGLWRHKRVDAELARLGEVSAKAATAGKASAEARRAKAETNKIEQQFNDRSTTVQRPCNHQATSDQDKAREERQIDNPISLSKPAREPEKPAARQTFPPDGSIAYGPFAEISRKAKPGVDPDIIASAFRRFCHGTDPPIPFDDPRIAKRFEGFAKGHRIHGH